VIPQTVVAFVFFLLLVAPGVTYELLYERRRPAVSETAFREAARIALYSFWFSFVACGIIALLRLAFPTGLFDPVAFHSDSKSYLKSYFTAIVWTVALEVLIALVLVFITDLFIVANLHVKLLVHLPPSVQKAISPYIRKHGIWWHFFEDAAWRKESTIPRLNIRLSDGTKIVGFLAMFTPYNTFDKTEIAITRGQGENGRMQLLDRKAPAAEQEFKTINDDVVWIRVEDISYLRVKYDDVPPPEP
jgi:hypothetical protein